MIGNLLKRRTRNSPQINTSDWDINLRRPRLLQKIITIKTNQRLIIMERAQDSVFFCSRDQLAEKAPVQRRQSQTTRNAFTISARVINSQMLATRSLVMAKINNHIMRARQFLLSLERLTRRKRSCSAMTITNDAQCIQLSARETNSQKLATRSHASPFATPIEIPLADGAICLQDHSQMTCSARKTTRRTS
jgi:hypothetical protein